VNNATQALIDENFVLIFSYAPAGLGHLRVISALHDGLPPEIDAVLLGSHDQSIKNIHRVISIHPIFKLLNDWLQSGLLSESFAFYYKKYLHTHTKLLYEQMLTLLEQRVKQPKKVLVVATHFGLAHQLVAVKERLEKEKSIKINLVVQVTDDTFHPMWYVEGAELIVVPSELAKQRFMDFAKRKSLPRTNIVVCPYPVNPRFFNALEPNEFKDRQDQLSINKSPSGFPASSKINISIPVSGAAVGTGFHREIIENLSKFSERFVFWVVTRNASYTRDFIKGITNLEHVKLFSNENDREVVDLYDHLFEKTILSLEITKPSEQAFKVLVPVQAEAGVIMLFTTPVGVQEIDNLKFMERHFLIPTEEETKTLLENYRNKINPQPELLAKSSMWRGLRLPTSAKESAEFIWWGLISGLLEKMLENKSFAQPYDKYPYELDKNGVQRFWIDVAKFIKEK